MPSGPPPSPHELHNRLVKAEAGIRSVEKALEALFRKVNVNRRRDPELDAVLEALAAMLHGLEKARFDRSAELTPRRVPLEMSATFVDEMPSVTPLGRSRRLRIVARDADGTEHDGGTVDVPEDE